jgi:hypothetical protein
MHHQARCWCAHIGGRALHVPVPGLLSLLLRVCAAHLWWQGLRRGEGRARRGRARQQRVVAAVLDERCQGGWVPDGGDVRRASAAVVVGAVVTAAAACACALSLCLCTLLSLSLSLSVTPLSLSLRAPSHSLCVHPLSFSLPTCGPAARGAVVAAVAAAAPCVCACACMCACAHLRPAARRAAKSRRSGVQAAMRTRRRPRRQTRPLGQPRRPAQMGQQRVCMSAGGDAAASMAKAKQQCERGN